MPLKHIVHLVDTYPLAHYKYIYDQVTEGEDKKGAIIAERFLGESLHNGFHYFRRFRNNGLLLAADNFLTDRVAFGNYLYLKALNSLYRKKLKSINASLMHAHSGMVGYKLSKLREELGIPLVVTFYGNDVSSCLKNDRWIRRYAGMFRAGDRFIVLCNEAKNRLIAHNCPEEKIRLWNIGLDLENYPYKERAYARPVKFLTVARFVEAKGYPDLLRAFSLLLKDYKDVTLTLSGFGPLKERILGLIRELKIQNNVTVIDTVGLPDFYSFLRGALLSHDIFVLPSTTSREGEDEGGPALTMIYAQATGMPVISTPFPGAEISVIDGETGLLCRQDNPASLSEKMAYLVDKNNLRKEMGLKGSGLVRKEFSFTPQLGKLHEIYGELL